jgi:hypothetical protein
MGVLLLSAGLLMAAAPPSTSTPPVRVPAALEGTWETSGQGPDAPDGTPGMGWSIELELKGDVYRRAGYPEWEERARISRVQRDGRTFRLTLVEHTRNGDTVTGEATTLVLSEDGRTVEFNGRSLHRTSRQNGGG